MALRRTFARARKTPGGVYAQQARERGGGLVGAHAAVGLGQLIRRPDVSTAEWDASARQFHGLAIWPGGGPGDTPPCCPGRGRTGSAGPPNRPDASCSAAVGVELDFMPAPAFGVELDLRGAARRLFADACWPCRGFLGAERFGPTAARRLGLRAPPRAALRPSARASAGRAARWRPRRGPVTCANRRARGWRGVGPLIHGLPAGGGNRRESSIVTARWEDIAVCGALWGGIRTSEDPVGRAQRTVR